MAANVGLVGTRAGVELRDLPLPEPGPGEVRIRVERAGVCRTDVDVGRGHRRANRPVVLGHELGGTVDSVGAPRLSGLLGAPVAVMPVWPDGRMLGVDRDGGFARFVVVPAEQVHPVAASVGPEVRAFLEPVAACLAPRVHLRSGDRTHIVGGGRIAELTARCLRAAGVALSLSETLPAVGSWDAIIETTGALASLDPLLDRLAPGGRLILKSRRTGTVQFSVDRALSRSVSVQLAHYADVGDALALLVAPELDLPSLCGATYPLSRWAEAFDAGESRKVFFDPWLLD